MPKASKAGTAVAVDEDVLEGRYAELDGYTVGFETMKNDADPRRCSEGFPKIAASARIGESSCGGR